MHARHLPGVRAGAADGVHWQRRCTAVRGMPTALWNDSLAAAVPRGDRVASMPRPLAHWLRQRSPLPRWRSRGDEPDGYGRRARPLGRGLRGPRRALLRLLDRLLVRREEALPMEIARRSRGGHAKSIWRSHGDHMEITMHTAHRHRMVGNGVNWCGCVRTCTWMLPRARVAPNAYMGMGTRGRRAA